MNANDLIFKNLENNQVFSMFGRMRSITLDYENEQAYIVKLAPKVVSYHKEMPVVSYVSSTETIPLDNLYIKLKDKSVEKSTDTTSFDNNRPLLGIIPKKYWQQERFYDLCVAISRYYDAGLPINVEWIEEYNELLEVVEK